MRVFAVALAALAAGSCSSWNTGSSDEGGPEKACLATCEALGRAGERCGLEYARAYDNALKEVANGDCKNVSEVRDERQLREVCLPSIVAAPCTKVVSREHDSSCSGQLQRSVASTTRARLSRAPERVPAGS